ncbi:MAG: hypothetical protein P8Z81_07225 [Deinococcales bacterium]
MGSETPPAVARRPGRRRSRALALVLVLTVAALPGCSPLYLPPVPARVPVPQLPQLGDASSLRVENGTLVLHVVLDNVPEEAWLAVQWFAPDGRQVASDSVWVTPADVGQGRTLSLPSRTALTSGEWRAVTSMRGRVLRQFSVEVPAAGGGTPAPPAP